MDTREESAVSWGDWHKKNFEILRPICKPQQLTAAAAACAHTMAATVTTSNAATALFFHHWAATAPADISSEFVRSALTPRACVRVCFLALTFEVLHHFAPSVVSGKLPRSCGRVCGVVFGATAVVVVAAAAAAAAVSWG